MNSPPEPAWLDALIGEIVVVDLDGPYVVFGRLTAWSKDHLDLADADLHDCREGSSTREIYALETRRLGVRANRSRVAIARSQVIAISRLAEVLG